MRRRFAPAAVPQHVVHRGHNRCRVFFDESDRRHYLDCLGHAAGKYACHMHAYVLMDNHVHLLLTPDKNDSLSRMLQWAAARYVRYVNDRLERTGTLWESRFRSSAILSARYLLTCYRYIELNPVRAGMVAHPSEHAWSSYRRNALGIDDPLIVEHLLYTRLAANRSGRVVAYRALFGQPLKAAELNVMRDGIQRREVAGRAARRRGRPPQVAAGQHTLLALET